MKLTYGVLRVLKTFKHVMLFTTHKCMADSHVLSQINHCSVVYSQCLIILLDNYSNFRTVLQDMFLVDIPLLLMLLI